MKPLRRLYCLVLVATGISAMLPASAEQETLQCNLARYELETIVRFDNHASERGLTVCGTPQMSARYKVQQYCGPNPPLTSAELDETMNSEKLLGLQDVLKRTE
jgi:hypothetical protein